MAEPAWITIQQKTFTRWMNTHLIDRNMPVQDITKDLSDGVVLINLLEIISNHTFKTYNKKPRIINQKLENLNFCLTFLKGQGIKLVAIGAEDIVNGNKKLILGLIWTIILRYHIEKGRQESAKNALLDWVRSKIPEYNIKNFTSSWADGKAICALDNALCPEAVNMSELGDDAMANATKGIDAAEQKMNIPRVMQPEDMVAAADDLSCMTYISYFRDYEEAMKKRLSEEEAARQAAELERTPDAAKCSASGLGLKEGEVNIPSDFTVTARNANGKQITVGGAKVDADITAPDGSKVSDITVADKENGTYDVTYIPRVPGKHAVVVKINEDPITKNPINVNVIAAQPDPSKCTASGEGVEGAQAGNPVEFVVQSCNRLGDPITTGGNPFTAKVKNPYGEEIPCELVDNGDGTYTGKYTPVPGVQEVDILCGKDPIANSPYKPTFEADPDKAFPEKTYAFGPGVEGGIDTFEPSVFTIQAVAPNGEKLTHGGDEFAVSVEDPNGEDLSDPEVKDNGDGTYTVTYQAKVPGPHTVKVNINKPENPLLSDPIKDSPYKVDVDAGFDPAKSTCEGPGLGDDVCDTVPAEFVVTAKDCLGEPLKKGGLPIEVKVTDPDGKPVDAKVKDNDDGTYDVKYEPEKPGKHTVQVECKDQPVAQSPYNVDVAAGADSEHSSVGAFMFAIQTKSKSGENLGRGGDSFEVYVTSKKDKDLRIDAQVTDNNDGSYTATYAVPDSGRYLVNVLLNGQKIKGSPYNQKIP